MFEQNPRTYGRKPFRIVAVHGGPGTPGYMAPVCREIGQSIGVMEPFQTQETLELQVDELCTQIKDFGASSVVLLGSSWGAVLSLLATAKLGSIVEKLVLVGSAVFDQQNSEETKRRREQRICESNRARLTQMRELLPRVSERDADTLLAEMVGILFDADTVAPVTRNLELLACQFQINTKVWSDFVRLRDTSGELAGQFAQIEAPVIVIHGQQDPHPLEGIKPFLEKTVRNVAFEVLNSCGHYPWIEKYAQQQFYAILRDELKL